MVQYSDFKRANDIYLEFMKIESLFESVDLPTLAYFEKEQDHHPFTSRKIIDKIIKLSLLIEAKIQKLPYLFQNNFGFEALQSLINYNKKEIKKNSYKIVRSIYEEYYYLETEFQILNIESPLLLDIVVNDIIFLDTRFTINDFVIWIKDEGCIYASYWLKRINDELNVNIDLVELDKKNIIKAWETHDKQLGNQDNKVLSRSYEKTISNSRIKIYDYRTAIEYIAFMKKESVKYKLPLFDTSINNKETLKLDRLYKYDITTNKSVRTVRK